MTALQIAWFWLIGAMLAVYVILDGCDLGIGLWHLVSRNKADRRALLAAISAYWDGNEVWLVAAGALLFAAFPRAYATILSGFYLFVMLVVSALISRAVSIEFASQDVSARWRRAWEIAFGAGSVVAGLGFGLAAGNILRGLPMDDAGNYSGTPLGLVNSYTIVVGAAGLAMMATHGAIFAQLKTKNETAARARTWALVSWPLNVVLLLAATGLTLATQPHLLTNYHSHPLLWALPGLMLAGSVLAGVFNLRRAPVKAFLCSWLGIAGTFATLGAALFPRLVPSTSTGSPDLSIANASSSPLTLKLMLGVTLVGLCIVVAYTLFVRRPFRGVIEDEELY